MEKSQKDIIQDYRNFKIEGIDNDLSDFEKDLIRNVSDNLFQIEDELSKLKERETYIKNNTTLTFTTIKKEELTRPLFSVDVDFNLEQKRKIFLHGKSGYWLWFENNEGRSCLVVDTKIKDKKIMLKLRFCRFGAKPGYVTRMTLDNFLYRVASGEFKIYNQKFIKTYLKPYEKSKYYKSSLNNIKSRRKELKEKQREIKSLYVLKDLNKRYNDTKKLLREQYKSVTKNEQRSTPADPAKIKRKMDRVEKAQSEIKTLWNTYIDQESRAYLIGWICKHIRNIKIKVVDGGVSDKVLSKAYPDNIYGSKYKEKANSSGWDASSGVINLDCSYKDNEHLNNILDKLSTKKHLSRANKNIREKEINNLDLTLFILSKYNKYGFISGTKEIDVDVKAMIRDEFAEPKQLIAFFDGYDAA